MNTKYLIGIDLGTSGTKAALFRADGLLVAEASMEVPLYYPRPGVVEQEDNDFYNSAAQTISKCIQSSGIDPRQVAAIAFDSQMPGVGSVDENYRPVTRFDSWLDMRCQPYIEWMDREAGTWSRALPAAHPPATMVPRCCGGRTSDPKNTTGW